jgi:hypothetical protein
MATLTGTQIKNTYQSLLKINTNGSLDPSTAITISDGLGNATPLQLAGNRLKTINSGTERGMDLNFDTSNYRFGDYNGYATYTYIDITAVGTGPAITLMAYGTSIVLDGVQGNVLTSFLGSYNLNAGFHKNVITNCDWSIFANPVNYIFTDNTIINTNGNLNISSATLINNCFLNNEIFTIVSSPDYALGERISNSLLFGLNNDIGPNNLNIYSVNTPTNVVVINGSDLEYNQKTSNVFSVNASSVVTDANASGVVILGGDYFDSLSNVYVTANHEFSGTNLYGVTIQGNKALVTNKFSRVVANSFENNSTDLGQVQIEDIQLFYHFLDGSLNFPLLNSQGESQVKLLSNSSYFFELKIVSVSNAVTSSNGNYVEYIGGLICVDSIGNVTIDQAVIKQYGQHTSGNYTILSNAANTIEFIVEPDASTGVECWVKADLKLNCVTS